MTKVPGGLTMNQRLLLLLFCLFVVMIGFGITQPVLPFYAERLHLTGQTTREAMALHVGLLTSIYALMQLLFAPFWGQWSDRVGRRPLVLLGIAGSAIAQVLFGMATTLWMLYIVRAIGGFLSSTMLPVATAYVADLTTDADRSQGIAWLGTAISLGVVAGPALGGLATRQELHFRFRSGHLQIDSFSLPFFIAAALAFLALAIALRWLPESLPQCSLPVPSRPWKMNASSKTLKHLLSLAIAGQFGLTIFEATFALYAQEKLGYGPVETGFAFMVCGLVMAIFQVVAVGSLTDRIHAIDQVSLGFGLMGTGVGLLLMVRTLPTVLGAIGILSLGMALITPNLTTLISLRGGQHKGAVLGLQNAANSLGQVGGPLFGGALFAWQTGAPYLFAGSFLVGVGLVIAWKEKQRGH
jgi:MFS transporter, DHA1 family, multidrug resistance protein